MATTIYVGCSNKIDRRVIKNCFLFQGQRTALYNPGVGNLQPAGHIRPASEFPLPKLNHNIASQRNSNINRYLFNQETSLSLHLVSIPPDFSSKKYYLYFVAFSITRQIYKSLRSARNPAPVMRPVIANRPPTPGTVYPLRNIENTKKLVFISFASLTCLHRPLCISTFHKQPRQAELRRIEIYTKIHTFQAKKAFFSALLHHKQALHSLDPDVV